MFVLGNVPLAYLKQLTSISHLLTLFSVLLMARSLPTNSLLDLLLLTSVILAHSVSASTNYTNTYYIIAGKSNGSLNHYLWNRSSLFAESSTRLVLSPGVHEVHSMYDTTIFTRYVNDIALIGSDGMTMTVQYYDDGQTAEIWQPETIIHCVGHYRGFIFYDVNNLTVKHITFRGCGANTSFIKMGKYIPPRGVSPNLNSAVAFVSVTNLYLENILVKDTVIKTRYDLILLNIWGQSTVKNVKVEWQNREPPDDGFDSNFLDLSIESVGGNVIVAYEDYYKCQADVVGEQKLNIISLTIFYLLHENITTDYSRSSKGAGLNTVMSSCTFPVRLYVDDYKYYAHVVGSTHWKASLQQRSHGISILTFDTALNFVISISRFSRIDSIENHKVATVGISVNNKHIARHRQYYPRCTCSSSNNRSQAIVRLKNIKLTGPHHIGIQVHIHGNKYLNENDSLLIVFENVRLAGVKADYPFVIAQVDSFNLQVVLDNITIDSTSAMSGQCVVVENVNNITYINDSSFLNNLCTALHNLNSEIVFQGNNIFFNNSGGYGGGMLIEGFKSYVVLDYNAALNFTRNHASFTGGAIHVSNRERTMFCFIRPYYVADIATIYFNDNTAEHAGTTLWGADVDKNNCERVKFVIKDWDPNNRSSVISSSPQHICFCYCSTRYLCAINSIAQYSVFPGQDFKIPLALAGELMGLVPGQVRAEVLNDSHVSLGALQTLQEVSRAECETLTYTLSLNTLTNVNKSILLELSALDSKGLVSPIIYEYSYLDETINKTTVSPMRIQVILKPCPLGFQLQQYCICLQQLFRLIQNASCDINTQTVERTAILWMNASYTGNNSQILAVHEHCPFDYCDHSKLRVDLSDPDQQCANNRAGILCGGCKAGLSLTLGSPKCKHCSNSYISLLAAFVTAGLALVVILTFLNLTVSTGTINALILYANIIRALNPIFFPTTTFLSVFVAWLNLDIGIDTCFYDGLDFYSLTWLQFIFPVYIWLLVSVMIITSHYSTRVSKLVSRDAVKVLATLFLLSYAKLLRTILTVLSFTYISYEDTSGATHQTAVWLYDGNVEFARGKHIPLLLTALGFGVLYIIPFTALLLFAPFLQMRSHRYIVLKWVNKVMPFLDAYQGPYTKHFRFWPGVFLLVRVVLFVSFAANGLGDPHINLIFIITITVSVMTLLWILEIVYKFGILYSNTSTNVLEIFYLVNIIFLSTWSLTQTESNSPERQTIISNILIGLSFCVFICIVVSHTYKQLKEEFSKCLMKILTRIKEKVCPTSKESDNSNTEAASDEQNSTSPGSNTRPVPKTVINFSDLRESLLTEH